MIQQKAKALTFYGMFTESKVGKTGLTVTVDVYEGTTATPIVSGGNATELAGGLYYYTLSSGSNDANGMYIAVFKTATTTVDLRHVPAAYMIPTWADEVSVVKEKTDNLPASPAAVGSAMTLADDAITSAKFDESTAFPLKSADTGATAVARTGADSDTLETLSDQMDTVKSKTDNIPAAPATEAKQDAIIGYLDTEIAAILEDTSTTIPAQISGLNNLSSAQVQTAAAAALTAYDPPTKAELDSAVSPLATTADLAVVGSNVDLILDDTNELQTNQGNWLTATGFSTHDPADVVTAMQAVAGDFKADVSGLATASDLATVDWIVDDIKAVAVKLDTALESDGAVYRFTENALEEAPTGGSAPSAADIADAVWDEATAGHTGAGTTGAALLAAGAAGDPNTGLPSSYTTGQIGYLIGEMAARLNTSNAVVLAALQGDPLNIRRGDTLPLRLTDLGTMTGYSEIWFTVKSAISQSDTEAVLQITTAGLQRINGAIGTAGNATLTVTDGTNGDVTITCAAEEMAKLAIRNGLYYDLQVKIGTTIKTLAFGRLNVVEDVTKVTS